MGHSSLSHGYRVTDKGAIWGDMWCLRTTPLVFRPPKLGKFQGYISKEGREGIWYLQNLVADVCTVSVLYTLSLPWSTVHYDSFIDMNVKLEFRCLVTALTVSLDSRNLTAAPNSIFTADLSSDLQSVGSGGLEEDPGVLHTQCPTPL